MSVVTSDVLSGKKLLVLGGTAQQVKFVEAARRRGVHTIVVDYLEDSPAKKVADDSFLLDIKDVKGIVELSRREGVDGVICGYIDPAQRPYQKICEALDAPCYGTREQFRLMTDKRAFKDLCIKSGVDVVPSYTEDDAAKGDVEFPVFVKPADSRGSRGQRTCFNREELASAIASAKSESSDGGVIIEKCMRGLPEFQVTYFFVGGEAFILRTADSYTGSGENGLEKVVLAAISPSVFADAYLERANGLVVDMLQSIGFENGPAFMQGFVDDGKFRFFDPGLRFPGVDYDRVLQDKLGIDVASALVEFALTGKMPKPSGIERAASLDGSAAAVLFPVAVPGVVDDVSCLGAIAGLTEVTSCIPRVRRGDRIEATGDINQRLAEIDLITPDRGSLFESIREIQTMMDVRSKDGTRMTGEAFDLDLIEERERMAVAL